jgi:hypothetical protein
MNCHQKDKHSIRAYHLKVDEPTKQRLNRALGLFSFVAPDS